MSKGQTNMNPNAKKVSDETIERVFKKAMSSKTEARKFLKRIGVTIARDGTVTVRPT